MRNLYQTTQFEQKMSLPSVAPEGLGRAEGRKRAGAKPRFSDHMPEEGSISLTFMAEKPRPFKSGWEIKSGGHIYMCLFFLRRL